MNLPTVDAKSIRGLKGKGWQVGRQSYFFGDDIRAGAEAFVIPLLSSRGERTHYLRILNPRSTTSQRIERTGWLIAQQLHKRDAAFEAAPQQWLSTLQYQRPAGVHFDYTGVLHKAVPGITWKAIKERADYLDDPLPNGTARQKLAKQLILSLAQFEELGLIHGDVSDANLIVDISKSACSLIDYDAFVCTGSETLGYPRLPVGFGGVKGTIGYMPEELEQNSGGELFPYSDRAARDMLLVELLSFQKGDPPDESARFWADRELSLERLRLVAEPLGLSYLCQPDLFEMAESERLPSSELSEAMGCRGRNLSEGEKRLSSRTLYPPVPGKLKPHHRDPPPKPISRKEYGDIRDIPILRVAFDERRSVIDRACAAFLVIFSALFAFLLFEGALIHLVVLPLQKLLATLGVKQGSDAGEVILLFANVLAFAVIVAIDGCRGRK